MADTVDLPLKDKVLVTRLLSAGRRARMVVSSLFTSHRFLTFSQAKFFGFTFSSLFTEVLCLNNPLLRVSSVITGVRAVSLNGCPLLWLGRSRGRQISAHGISRSFLAQQHWCCFQQHPILRVVSSVTINAPSCPSLSLFLQLHGSAWDLLDSRIFPFCENLSQNQTRRRSAYRSASME